MCTINDSKPGNPLVLHDEPIFYDNKIVGESTSGNYSFKYDKNLVFGYVTKKIDLENNTGKLEIEIAKKRYKLSLLNKPLHDPLNHFTKI